MPMAHSRLIHWVCLKSCSCNILRMERSIRSRMLYISWSWSDRNKDDTKKHVLFVFGRKDGKLFKEAIKSRSVFVILVCDKCTSPALQCITYWCVKSCLICCQVIMAVIKFMNLLSIKWRTPKSWISSFSFQPWPIIENESRIQSVVPRLHERSRGHGCHQETLSFRGLQEDLVPKGHGWPRRARSLQFRLGRSAHVSPRWWNVSKVHQMREEKEALVLEQERNREERMAKAQKNSKRSSKRSRRLEKEGNSGWWEGSRGCQRRSWSCEGLIKGLCWMLKEAYSTARFPFSWLFNALHLWFPT